MISVKPMIRLAAYDDNQALLELIFRSPQAGRVLLGSDRSPDFFARAVPYDESRAFIAEDEAGIAGIVSCGLKSVLVGGEVQRAAYIFDLAVAERARGQGHAKRLLAGAEAWARDNEADFLYAHVLAGNRAGLGAFAAADYRQVARLTSRLFPVPVSPRGRGGAQQARVVEERDWPELGILVQHEFCDHDLRRAVTAEGLRALWEGLPGYRAEQVWVIGEPPAAVLGLWDYSPVGRAVLLRLPPELRMIPAVSRLLRRARLPFPAVPSLGQPFRYGFLLGGGGSPQALQLLLRRALAEARNLGMDSLVLFHDPRTPPAWLRALNFAGSYHLLAKVLRTGPATTLGERPLWVDPVDL
jgi:ribosomal protein S18 acetylase RimI-like enzyme